MVETPAQIKSLTSLMLKSSVACRDTKDMMATLCSRGVDFPVSLAFVWQLEILLNWFSPVSFELFSCAMQKMRSKSIEQVLDKLNLRCRLTVQTTLSRVVKGNQYENRWN